MRALLTRQNLKEAALFAIVITWVQVMTVWMVAYNPRWELVLGTIQWILPVGFTARLLSAKIVPFEKHPVVTTAGVFASAMVSIAIMHQGVSPQGLQGLADAPAAFILTNHLFGFLASFLVAIAAAALCWVLEQPWRNRQAQPTA